MSQEEERDSTSLTTSTVGSASSQPISQKSSGKQQQQPKQQKQQQGSQQQKGAKQQQRGQKDGGGSGSSSGGGALKQQQQQHQHQNQQQQQHRLHLFDHLPKQESIKHSDSIEMRGVSASSAAGSATGSLKDSAAGSGGGTTTIHPATLKLGLLYRQGLIRHDDDRIVALIAALKCVVVDYETPPKKQLRYDIDKCVSAQVQYLVRSRPMCVGMGNLVKFLRHCITLLPPPPAAAGAPDSGCVATDDSRAATAVPASKLASSPANGATTVATAAEYEATCKASILAALSSFLEDRIINARSSIARLFSGVGSGNGAEYSSFGAVAGTAALRDDDIVLTFGTSPLVLQILLEAKARADARATAKTKPGAGTGDCFRVIVVDTRPLLDGRHTLHQLTAAGIPCTYTLLTAAASYAVWSQKNVTRVLLGASAVCSNGSILAPAGTAMLACIAKSHRIPIIFAAETYKFTSKVQLDSIVHNELGNPLEIAIPLGSLLGTAAAGHHSHGLAAHALCQSGMAGVYSVNMNCTYANMNMQSAGVCGAGSAGTGSSGSGSTGCVGDGVPCTFQDVVAAVNLVHGGVAGHMSGASGAGTVSGAGATSSGAFADNETYVVPVESGAAGADVSGAGAIGSSAGTDGSSTGSGGVIPLHSVPQMDSNYRGGVPNASGSGGGAATVLPFSVCSLRYDLTPIANVTVLATEAGLLPPTSVPILLKDSSNKQQNQERQQQQQQL